VIRGLAVKKMSRLSSPDADDEFWRWIEATFDWDDTPEPPPAEK